MYSAAFIFEPGKFDAEFHRFHPRHLEAKRQYSRWYDGFHIVVAVVVRSYGDGAFAHVTPNERHGPA